MIFEPHHSNYRPGYDWQPEELLENLLALPRLHLWVNKLDNNIVMVTRPGSLNWILQVVQFQDNLAAHVFVAWYRQRVEEKKP